MLVASIKIDFSVTTCRFLNVFFISLTILTIVKAIRSFSTENKFYVLCKKIKRQQGIHKSVS